MVTAKEEGAVSVCVVTSSPEKQSLLLRVKSQVSLRHLKKKHLTRENEKIFSHHNFFFTVSFGFIKNVIYRQRLSTNVLSVYIYIYVHMYVYISLCIYMYARMYLYMSVCIKYKYTYIHTYINVCVSIHIYKYIYTWTYIHTFIYV